MDLYYADPAQPLTTAGEELDDLDRDLSDLSTLVRFDVGAGRRLARQVVVELLRVSARRFLGPMLFVFDDF